MKEESLHIVCPNCEAVNRLPRAKLAQHPNCGKCHQPLFSGKPVELTNTNFSSMINHTDIPIVVDFWAPWCGPCKMMAPIFEHAAATIEPRARLAKLNTEVTQEVASKYGIRSIPTLIIFLRGKEVIRQAGALDKNNLIRFIEENL
jgi:thioredoxin 2